MHMRNNLQPLDNRQPATTPNISKYKVAVAWKTIGMFPGNTQTIVYFYFCDDGKCAKLLGAPSWAHVFCVL